MFEPEDSSTEREGSLEMMPLERPQTLLHRSADHRSHFDIDDREVTALERVRTRYSQTSAARRPSISSSYRRPRRGWAYYIHPVKQFWHAVKQLWRREVNVVVDHAACRDHLALERTFLAYLRTSLAISVMGLTIAQLFRLNHSGFHNATFGFYVLGKPLAVISQFAACFVLFLGAYKSWRHQRAVVRGKAITGGFEMWVVGAVVFTLLFTLFVLTVGVDISKDVS